MISEFAKRPVLTKAILTHFGVNNETMGVLEHLDLLPMSLEDFQRSAICPYKKLLEFKITAEHDLVTVDLEFVSGSRVMFSKLVLPLHPDTDPEIDTGIFAYCDDTKQNRAELIVYNHLGFPIGYAFPEEPSLEANCVIDCYGAGPLEATVLDFMMGNVMNRACVFNDDNWVISQTDLKMVAGKLVGLNQIGKALNRMTTKDISENEKLVTIEAFGKNVLHYKDGKLIRSETTGSSDTPIVLYWTPIPNGVLVDRVDPDGSIQHSLLYRRHADGYVGISNVDADSDRALILKPNTESNLE